MWSLTTRGLCDILSIKIFLLRIKVMTYNTDVFMVKEILKNKGVDEEAQNSNIERDDIYRKIEYCKICGDLADSYHYSVSSCRGCNAFFRRAINLNMTFVCRHGGNCLINKNTRCACRSCRFNKCIKAGMDPMAVQPKRDYNKDIIKNRNDVESESSTPYEILETKSPDMYIDKKWEKMSNTSFSARSSISTQLNFEETPKSTYHELNYLFDLITKYSEDCQRRRILCCDTIEEMLLPNNYLPQPCFINDITATFKIEMSLMFQWISNVPGFSNISSPKDKARLIKEFSSKFYILNILANTIDLGLIDKIMLVNNRYILPQICPISDSQNMFHNQLVNILYGKTCLNILEELVKPMKEMNIEIFEIIALRIIMFWNPGSIGLSKENRWYELKGKESSEITLRVSKIILLIPDIVKIARTLNEILETLDNDYLISFGDDSLKKILTI
ncbi:Transcription factor HNF-4 homolog [Strongyloides ratti]|uniref:Transcription factor HNF-4 homolog n=1 Tax=Strongyloides ratti TaxID=34506 RepID=A0A090L1P5_STRRB|nr:Transcription factor HNF-4 homolog [Strongyloides ratti]CEF63691.1 Transcription factor HNF-4 homolog [Strongyloides ratti]